MNGREATIIRSMTETTWRFYAWVSFLGLVLLLGLYAFVLQLRQGLIVTGLRDQVAWGLYISNFVFWVGVSKGGTMISAILRVTDSQWRRPVTRIAEAITVLALLVGAPMIIADLGRPDRMWHLVWYGRIQSPLIWDFISVTTYFTACLIYFYLPMIPDAGLLAERTDFPRWRRQLYKTLSLGWSGTPEQKHLLERAINMMAIIVIPLAVSVHTVVAWLFAMTLRPGWNSSIFGPYFVVGAIYSGGAAVILSMGILRKIFHLEEYVHPAHFRKLGLLLLTSTLLYLYFNINEYLTAGYKLEGFERELLEMLFVGSFAKLFWIAQMFGVIIPILILVLVLGLKRLNHLTVGAVMTSSTLVVLGAWLKRFLIVVPTQETPFLPAQRLPAEWTHYQPTWVEWAIVAAGLAAFLLFYSVVLKLFPIVSFWETREDEAPGDEPTVLQAMSKAPMRGMAMILMLMVLVGVPAAASKKTAPKPTVLVLQYEALKHAEAPASMDAASSTQPVGVPNLTKVVERPFELHHRRAPEKIAPAIEVRATLSDATGAPITFKPVAFSIQMTFGVLALGTRPTDASGIAKLKITDNRFGSNTLRASFSGDDAYLPTESQLVIKAADKPGKALPEEGMMISPTPTFWVAAPFTLFFGTMWVVFLYAFGYLIIWRMRRTGGKYLA